MEVFCDKKTSKNITNFVCEVCDFSCCKKGDWNRHIKRPKHINLTLSNACCDIKNTYTCDTCDKIYNSRNGLWNHKKKCQEISIPTQNEPTDKELILLLLKEHTKIMEQNSELLEVIKNGTHNTTNSHNTITNKTFNLQFFLNETCKDAMNIMDFVDSIKLQLSD